MIDSRPDAGALACKNEWGANLRTRCCVFVFPVSSSSFGAGNHERLKSLTGAVYTMKSLAP